MTDGQRILKCYIEHGAMGSDPATVLPMLELCSHPIAKEGKDMDAAPLPDDVQTLLDLLDAERRTHAEYQARAESDRVQYLARCRELEAEVARLTEFSGLLKLDNEFLTRRKTA